MSPDDELLDPQLYRGPDGKVKRRVGRPRKDPRGTQAELRARKTRERAERRMNEELERARRREEAQAKAAESRQFMREFVAKVVNDNKGGELHEALVWIVDQTVQACQIMDTGLTADQVRNEVPKYLVELIKREYLSGSSMLELHIAKAAEATRQHDALKAHLAAPVPAQATPNLAATPSLDPQPSSSFDSDEIDIEALMEAGLPSGDDD